MAIKVRGEAARSMVAVRDETRALLMAGTVTEADAIRHAASCSKNTLSKFQPCLPEALELRFLARRLLELPGSPMRS
jgi:hypothetical protein